MIDEIAGDERPDCPSGGPCTMQCSPTQRCAPGAQNDEWDRGPLLVAPDGDDLKAVFHPTALNTLLYGDDNPPSPISPPHYQAHPSGIECITIAEHMNFTLGNAVKYIWRAGLKGGAIEVTFNTDVL